MIKLTDENFDNEIKKSDIPIIVDFWAPWCGPCRMVRPILEELETEFAGKINFAELNTDENQQIPIKYGISAIPTLIIFKNSKPIEKIVGAYPKTTLREKLNSVL